MMQAWSPPEMQPGGQASWEETAFKHVILHLRNPDVQEACDETSGFISSWKASTADEESTWRELLDLVKSSTPSGWCGAQVEHIIRPPMPERPGQNFEPDVTVKAYLYCYFATTEHQLALWAVSCKHRLTTITYSG